MKMNEQAIDRDRMDEANRLRVAAGFDSERAAPSLFQFIGQRKLAAQQLIKTPPDSDTAIELEKMVIYCNENIKQILAL